MTLLLPLLQKYINYMLKNICATRMSLMCLRPPSDQRPRPIHLGHQHYVSILRRRKKGYIVIMEESDENEEYFEVIPMKQCHQRSRSLPFNQFRQIPEVEKPRKSSAHVTLNRVSTKSNNSFRVSTKTFSDFSRKKKHFSRLQNG